MAYQKKAQEDKIKAGPKPKPDAKKVTYPIAVTVTPEVGEMIKAAAEEAGLPVSTWCRLQLTAALSGEV